jgi:hypothetical protein
MGMALWGTASLETARLGVAIWDLATMGIGQQLMRFGLVWAGIGDVAYRLVRWHPRMERSSGRR